MNDACLKVVDVSTLGEPPGWFFMTFIHMVYNVCWSIADVSTLTAVSGHMFMKFSHMVYNISTLSAVSC